MTTATAAPAFDAVAFKTTTRAQWQAAAEAWHRWGPFLGRWLGDATETMFELAHIGPGSRVLDVAAGAGEQSIGAARRAGASGRVLATDIAPALLERAAADARAAGLSNLETLELDGEALDTLPAGSFDAAISRVGLIYFPDQQRALAGMRRALRPGGRVSAVVYSTPERNAFFSIPVRIIRERAQLPAPLPGQPGPFSLGAEGALEAAFAKAGLRDIEVSRVPSPVRLASAAECVRFERESFGALHQMMVRLDEAERASTWDAIEEALRQFESSVGFVGPCEMLVGAGRK
ncbi:class I SAM-dependent methyltransferase [Variovorax paradoxus]|uniref:Ubiquinone/menaquinone biosynthesis C-methyltransferase UbiE n=1 Tax=Variovorax paradoxus TaxID=34073 RepID=A0A0H2M6H5_VARPD|nr:methyltransferase domain-containing protein [Variovorax paradoxus]KLN58019.1 ubiquinone/menaquinone biosynthesis C-methyltransferase UbiE [Variovorax paradoxus]